MSHRKILVLFGLGLLAGVAAAQADGDVSALKPVVVLDTAGSWRLHQQLAPPIVTAAEGVETLEFSRRWLSEPTPAAPDGWAAPQFDDHRWLRGSARRAGWTAMLSRLRLRGKFLVSDADAVKGLTLNVAYQGGVIVYVNGREVARRHIVASDGADPVVAEPYTDEAFLTDNELLTYKKVKKMPAAERARLRKAIGRELTDVRIPTSALRSGVNVVAIEIIRAPYPRVVLDRRPTNERRMTHFLRWNTCELRHVQVTATSTDGLTPNATRPHGLQVFNSDLMATDFDLDFGDPTDRLGPIRIVGVRNGSFSGKVAVASDEAIEGLTASVGDLTGPAGSISGRRVDVRWSLPWGSEAIYDPYESLRRPSPYPGAATPLTALSETAPATVPVRPIRVGRNELAGPNQPAATAGAVVGVWVTVHVPADAAPGEYAGELTIRAAGADPVRVPVTLRVIGWTLPDPGQRRTWAELMQIPDTTAMEYELPLFSDEHFEMIARSLKLVGDVGSKVVYVPLIAETNLGNAESMVRWIPNDDGTYRYDFTVMDRYLDTVLAHMGKPRLVVFSVWEIYLLKAEKFKASSTMRQTSIDARQRFAGRGPLVTMVDPATGQTRNEHLPLYDDPAAAPMWRTLFEQIRGRLRAKGLEDSIALGILSDVMPTEQEVVFLTDVSGDAPWIVHQHHGLSPKADYRLHGVARIAYQTRVWNIAFGDDGPSKRGWARPSLFATYERTRDLNTHPPTKWRHMAEYNITGTQRGCGRIGADNWAVIRDKRGRRVGRAADRYPHADWRNLNLYSALLAPGPDGPVATHRYEAFREGLQECEARIVIEQTLGDPTLRAKLKDETVRRCESLLAERTEAMFRGMSPLKMTGPAYKRAGSWRGRPGVAGHLWFVGSGWQDRTAALYEAAAEVTDAVSE